MLGLHDCFSITESVIYKSLGVCPRGKTGDGVRDGLCGLYGKIPCRTDGGLKGFDRPIGAPGLRMMYEMYKRLQGKAGDRQINDPDLFLTHNMGWSRQ
jgi:acetyl-CoA C-acetyltransferase